MKQMKYELVNLTPHKISVHNNYSKILDIEPSGSIARISTSYKDVRVEVVGLHDAVRVAQRGDTERLPEATLPDGKYRMSSEEPQVAPGYIVSLLVAQAAWEMGRTDVFAPGELIRDDSGRPVGCQGLIGNP